MLQGELAAPGRVHVEVVGGPGAHDTHTGTSVHVFELALGVMLPAIPLAFTTAGFVVIVYPAASVCILCIFGTLGSVTIAVVAAEFSALTSPVFEYSVAPDAPAQAAVVHPALPPYCGTLDCLLLIPDGDNAPVLSISWRIQTAFKYVSVMLAQ